MASYIRSFLLLLLSVVLAGPFTQAATPDADNKAPKEKTPDKEDNKKARPGHINRVLVYRDPAHCKDCGALYDELKKHNVDYQDIDLGRNRKQQMILRRKAGKENASYVFIGNKYIGNHENLLSIIKQGRLFKILRE